MIKFNETIKPKIGPNVTCYRDVPPFSFILHRGRTSSFPSMLLLDGENYVMVYDNKLIPQKFCLPGGGFENFEYEVYTPARNELKLSVDNVIAKTLKLFKQGDVVINLYRQNVYIVLTYDTVIHFANLDADGIYLVDKPCVSHFGKFNQEFFTSATLTITRIS